MGIQTVKMFVIKKQKRLLPQLHHETYHRQESLQNFWSKGAMPASSPEQKETSAHDSSQGVSTLGERR